METDEMETTTQQTKKKSSDEKKWKKHGPEKYRNTVSELVHFSVKTVNSNANAAGIRIGKETALHLPYVSARTLIGAGVQLELDYAKGGAASSGIVSQIYGVIDNRDFALAATEEEREAILQAMEDPALENAYAFGIESVDSRLRQLLIPPDLDENGRYVAMTPMIPPHLDKEGSYVSITPITSNGLCHYLTHNQTGLVAQHNAKASDDAKNARDNNTPRQYRRIRQAHFGIGGANTQNVGRLVSNSMHNPIFVQGPQPPPASLRRAFSIYRRGINIDFNRYGVLRSELFKYRPFPIKNKYLPEKTHEEGSSLAEIQSRFTTGKQQYTENKRHIESICNIILEMGEEARNVLRANLHQIPELKTLSDEGRTDPDKWLSRSIPNAIRGLIIPELRKEGDWSRDMASFIVERMRRATKTSKNNESALPLGARARNQLIVILRRILSRKVSL